MYPFRASYPSSKPPPPAVQATPSPSRAPPAGAHQSPHHEAYTHSQLEHELEGSIEVMRAYIASQEERPTQQFESSQDSQDQDQQQDEGTVVTSTSTAAGSTSTSRRSSTTITSPNRTSKGSKKKAPKKPLSDASISLAENKKIVTESEWYSALQQEVDSMKEHMSERKKFPDMFQVAAKYTQAWSDNGWEGPYNATNHTYFKNKLVKHMNFWRERQDVSHHMDIVRHIAAGRDGDLNEEIKKIVNGQKVYVYLQDAFLDYAIRNFRTDMIGREKMLEKHSQDDIVRLWSILGMNENRHLLLSLVRKKAMSRSELDGARSSELMIFDAIAKSFNDKELVVVPPKSFDTLDNKETIDPNNPSRIDIKRSGSWLYELFKKVLAEYKVAMHKWKSGTGGGSGAPKDYHQWDKRDAKLFSNYGGIKGGVPVKKDYLGYMMMTDIDSGWAFLSSFLPAPKNTVLEDGVQFVHDSSDSSLSHHDSAVDSSHRPSKRSKKGDKSTAKATSNSTSSLGNSLLHSIEKINTSMTKTLVQMNREIINSEKLPDTPTTADTSTADKITEMTMAVELVTTLENRRSKLLEEPESSGRDMKLRLTDIALKRAESLLVKSASTEDETED